MSLAAQQREIIRSRPGFIAALDQSGGSTPKALGLYGVQEGAWSSEAEMFDLVHAMRTRIMTSPAFSGERILGAILFENTMNRQVEGRGAAAHLWEAKQVVPFLKVDKGLAEEGDGVQLMKPMPTLEDLLEQGKAKGVFGTKMRSVIKQANEAGINAVVAQQFDTAKRILAAGLTPIVEPEVDIHCPEKGHAETLLKTAMLKQLDALNNDPVILKLTLPEVDNFYAECIAHPPGAAGGRSLWGLQPEGVQRPLAPAKRHDRQLLPGADRRAEAATNRCGVQRPARCVHRRHLCGVNHLARTLH